MRTDTLLLQDAGDATSESLLNLDASEQTPEVSMLHLEICGVNNFNNEECNNFETA